MTVLCAIVLIYALTAVGRLFFFHNARARAKSEQVDVAGRPLAIIIPALREQSKLPSTLRHLSRICPAGARVVVVTTAAERAQTAQTTAEVVDKLAEEINANKGFQFLTRIHYPYSGGIMAHQINYGVRYLFEAYSEEIDPGNQVIGILNADSLPEKRLLDEAVTEITPSTPAIQSPSVYFLPSENRSVLCASVALWQTRWSLCVEYWRIKTGDPRTTTARVQSVLAPYRYVVGHGLFMRMKDLVEINYLPTFCSNEDAALGFLLKRYGLPICATTALDKAEVAAEMSQFLRQQAGWIAGPAGGLSYATYCARNGLYAPSWLHNVLDIAKVLWDALIWVIGPVLFVSALVSVALGSAAGLCATFAFLAYLYLPTLLLWPLISDILPGKSRGATLLALISMPIVYVLHGVGGFVGLFAVCRSALLGHPYVKPKTER